MAPVTHADTTDRRLRLLIADPNREAIDSAKRMLMEDRRLSEADAYRYLQMRSMRSRRSMGEVAEALLVSRSVIHETTPQNRETQAVRENHPVRESQPVLERETIR